MTPREIQLTLTVACPLCGAQPARYCTDLSRVPIGHGRRVAKRAERPTQGEPHGVRFARALDVAKAKRA